MIDHWTEEERAALTGVSSFEEAANVALVILARMHAVGHPIVQICGPMSTGGAGNLELNMARFQKAVDIAIERGLTVFDQIPFQDAIIRLSNFHESEKYNDDILEIFYRRIFEAGYISKALFLPDWHSSKGATWEREFVSRLGLAVDEYPPEWLE